MYAERHEVSVTTVAAGTGTGYTPVIRGRITNVIYVKDATNPYDNGVTFAMTLEKTGQTVWAEAAVNASKTVAPRQATHDTAGAASLHAAGGEPVEDYIVAADDRVQIAVSAGGNTKTGKFYVVVA